MLLPHLSFCPSQTVFDLEVRRGIYKGWRWAVDPAIGRNNVYLRAVQLCGVAAVPRSFEARLFLRSTRKRATSYEVSTTSITSLVQTTRSELQLFTPLAIFSCSVVHHLNKEIDLSKKPSLTSSILVLPSSEGDGSKRSTSPYGPVHARRKNARSKWGTGSRKPTRNSVSAARQHATNTYIYKNTRARAA